MDWDSVTLRGERRYPPGPWAALGGRGRVPSRTGSGSRHHGRTSVALLVAGCLFTALAGLSLWSWRSFANSQGFADVATDMLKEPAVR